jgi:Protein of unknown function (DUF2721)
LGDRYNISKLIKNHNRNTENYALYVSIVVQIIRNYHHSLTTHHPSTHTMELSLNTPALLFSIVALLMVAFTNRFMAIAGLIRDLHDKFQKDPQNHIITRQLKNLRTRVKLIRNMQIISVISLLLSVICMFLIFLGLKYVPTYIFSISLILMCVALVMSAWEIAISTEALNIELSDMEES